MRSRTAALLVVAVAGAGFLPGASAAESGPEATTIVRPASPAEAQRAGIPGCAMLEFDVSASGHPEHIRIAASMPYPEFGAAARSALAQWRFTPAQRNGRAVPVHDVKQGFVFPLSGANSSAPGCGGAAAVVAVPNAAAAAATVTAPATVEPPKPPVSVPTRVTLNITRPAVTQEYKAASGFPATTGSVTLKFCVDKAGNTKNIRIIRSSPPNAFDSTAVGIMRAAKFKPHLVEGVPVEACGITQTIEFKPLATH